MAPLVVAPVNVRAPTRQVHDTWDIRLISSILVPKPGAALKAGVSRSEVTVHPCAGLMSAFHLFQTLATFRSASTEALRTD